MELASGWTHPLALLQGELVQLADEGWIIPERLRERVDMLHPVHDAYNEAPILALYAELEHLERDPGFDFVQPNELDAIRRERPDGPRQLPLKLTDDELLDRLHGAWTGRACGCALGKPVEGLGMHGFQGRNGREAIRHYLQQRGHWELDYYFSGPEAADGSPVWCQASWRENIAYMEPDDDIHYSLIGLKVLEERGPEFCWHDVADCWNNSLPYNAICTAETQAILNYNLRRPRGLDPSGVVPVTAAFTRRHNNPYREWIGAQIRADGWAYACAGNPELAAEFAWRDASWTHTANGIYGEMFMAAVIAAAFVEHDPARLVEIGLSEIPRRCRLAAAVREALAWIPECPTFEAFMERVEQRHAGMSPVHTVNNALIVVMSLFYGKMAPDRSICVSVMGALDTDCNGATTGSIVGAAAGRRHFGGKLAAPLHDTVKPLVFGFQQTTFAELAERTLRVHHTVSRYAEARKQR
ncbi:MAG: ADP-ribosylglycohydrolase family protein [Lentisphaeria bacterium]